MSIERWQTAWRDLIAPGAPFEVVTPDDGAPRYFRHAAHNLMQVFDAGRVHGDREFLVWQSQRLTFNQFFDQVAPRGLPSFNAHFCFLQNSRGSTSTGVQLGQCQSVKRISLWERACSR